MTSKYGYVYILSNENRNVLYIGVTSDLIRRIWEHRNMEGSCFTAKYNLRYLMYWEQHKSIQRAIEREKQLKNWKRAWKIELIKEINPRLRDLWPDLSSHFRKKQP